MSIKTILVLLDESSDSSARLDVACSLALAHDAHLSALAVSQHLSAYISAGMHADAAMIDVGQIEEARKAAQALAASAREQMDARGVLGETHWASHEVFGLREAAGIYGRYADLVIAGQPAAGNSLELRDAVLEGALFASGRPVLMIPTQWDKPISASHVVVAWDASKQAARAVHDAALFLDRAARITIVIVDPKPGHDSFGPDPGADIAAVLSRHCKNVVLDRIPSTGTSIASAVLARTADTASDLIVMGGYGHSILREAVFGGVSREMIETANVPILLSH